MSNLVTHIVCEAGHTFNTVLHPDYRATAADLTELAETGSLWDARLTDNALDFSVELTGLVTISWLPIKYSRFLSDETERNQVHQWENALKRRLPSVRTIRIDEFLLENWDKDVDDYWFRVTNDVTRFFTWLDSQDKQEWATI